MPDGFESADDAGSDETNGFDAASFEFDTAALDPPTPMRCLVASTKDAGGAGTNGFDVNCFEFENPFDGFELEGLHQCSSAHM